MMQYHIELKDGEQFEADIEDSGLGLDGELSLYLSVKEGFRSVYMSQIKYITKTIHYLHHKELSKDMMSFLIFRDRKGWAEKLCEYIEKYLRRTATKSLFKDYWRDEVGESSKRYYSKCLEQYITEYYGGEYVDTKTL